ncbi:uncharacterized protein OCT59_025620 [Rhizophagus irregularis]|uniref:uncharacterized protein n=1 Tax=Rhizophagus irregularis TaxID=588596 RepID=UPI000CB86498|nr:hypothetical protein OCT59_025620 [Rhizophagus irregularis]GBC11238.1 hypothetical protein GLOIN_2v1834164 [Rhizophagus irregularis DAOM 181602=DAOM 197198]
MFLFESCCLFRKTEPKFFSILRLLIALFFSCALGYYILFSFYEFVSEIKTEDSITFTYPNFSICQRTLSDYDNNSILRISLYKLYKLNKTQKYIPENYSFYDKDNDNKTMTKFYPYMSNYLYINNSIPKSSEFFVNDDLDNRCMKFTPNDEYYRTINYFNGKRQLKIFNTLLFIITVDNSSIYDYFEINFQSFKKNDTEMKLNPNPYFITPGKYNIYNIYYKNTNRYSSQLSGFLGFDADKNYMSIVISHGVLAQIPNTFNTVLEISFDYNFIIKEDINFSKNNVKKLIENFGGFYGAISGIFVFLFGASKLSPWGICQIYLLRCWPCRQRFKESLANRYVSRVGIPLVEDPCNLPENGRIEDRVAILEILLKEYYIDDYYLVELRKTREKYLRISGDEIA